MVVEQNTPQNIMVNRLSSKKTPQNKVVKTWSSQMASDFQMVVRWSPKTLCHFLMVFRWSRNGRRGDWHHQLQAPTGHAAPSPHWPKGPQWTPSKQTWASPIKPILLMRCELNTPLQLAPPDQTHTLTTQRLLNNRGPKWLQKAHESLTAYINV